MPPQEAPDPELASNSDDEEYQSIYIVRHGDRWDYENPEVGSVDSLPACTGRLRQCYEFDTGTGTAMLDKLLALF
jgi:hypothetical protein